MGGFASSPVISAMPPVAMPLFAHQVFGCQPQCGGHGNAEVNKVFKCHGNLLFALPDQNSKPGIKPQ
jgi:hypothetical protein